MNLIKFIFLLSILIVTNAYTLITGSKHDLTYYEYEIDYKVTDDSSDVCIFCHTPHGATSEFNKTTAWDSSTSSESYSVYGTASNTTFNNSVEENLSSNPSKACLSCHDGVSAINSVANTGTSSDIDLFDISSGTQPVAAKPISFDHPISVEYKGDGTKHSPASLRDINGKLGGNGKWHTTSDNNNIKDLLRGENSNQIECSSCHDPHLGEATTFLRTGDNAGSKLCLGCHEK